MAELKGRVTSAREQQGYVWLHARSRNSSGWVSLEQNIFDTEFKRELLEKIHGKHNKNIEQQLHKLEKERAELMKKENTQPQMIHIEQKIHALRSLLKKTIQPHELIGKEIRIRLR
jgi:hypothetical protein